MRWEFQWTPLGKLPLLWAPDLPLPVGILGYPCSWWFCRGDQSCPKVCWLLCAGTNTLQSSLGLGWGSAFCQFCDVRSKVPSQRQERNKMRTKQRFLSKGEEKSWRCVMQLFTYRLWLLSWILPLPLLSPSLTIWFQLRPFTALAMSQVDDSRRN